MFLLPKNYKVYLFEVQTVIGWKAGSSLAYCEPCFKKVMEESELKAIVSTSNRTAPGPDELPF